jgi:hypothetical protein
VDWIEPRTCIDENLTVDDNGQLCFRPWAVPRPVRDVRVQAPSSTTAKFPQITMPGFLLVNQQIGWVNDSPLECEMLLSVFRSWKEWETSNPNVLQFRDRWTWAIDRTPEEPVTTGIFNSQTGGGIDLGTNTVAEPMPGRQWVWMNANMSDEIVGPVPPGSKINMWYRMYVWSPPPWSDNANKNNPKHTAKANFVRLMMTALPQQGTLVTG